MAEGRRAEFGVYHKGTEAQRSDQVSIWTDFNSFLFPAFISVRTLCLCAFVVNLGTGSNPDQQSGLHFGSERSHRPTFGFAVTFLDNHSNYRSVNELDFYHKGTEAQRSDGVGGYRAASLR